MFAVRRALCFGVKYVRVPRRGCAGAIPVDDVVNGLTDDQIQVTLRSLEH